MATPPPAAPLPPVSNDDILLELRTLRREFRQMQLRLDIMNEGRMASDIELLDPKIRFIPKQWKKGGVRKEMLASECPPEFLLCYARCMENMAENERADGKKWQGKLQWPMTLAQARIMRRWAFRLMTGYEAPEKEKEPDPEESSFGKDVPFDGEPTSAFGQSDTFGPEAEIPF